MIRRLPSLRIVFDEDEPTVYILAPAPNRPIPAGDTRRGTAWIFRGEGAASDFSTWVKAEHGVQTVPVRVPLRPLMAKLAGSDLTWVLDPKPRMGHGTPLTFKAPLLQ